MKSLSIVGTGEDARRIADGLAGEGIAVVRVSPMPNGSAERGAVMGAPPRDGFPPETTLPELLEQSGFVLNLAAPEKTEKTACMILERPPGMVFIDGSSSSPLLKKRLAGIFSEKGRGYVDAAFMESPLTAGHRAQMVCSGQGAHLWARSMRMFGMHIDVMQGAAGTASGFRLVKNFLLRGAEAILAEGFFLARSLRLETEALSALAGAVTADTLESQVIQTLCAGAISAETGRRELEEAAELMAELGIDPAAARGAARRLGHVESLGIDSQLRGVPPKDLPELYGLWDALARDGSFREGGS